MTSDLRLRIGQHNRGESNFTNRGLPWKLMYYEAFTNKDDAANEEKFLKSGKGRERINYLLEKTLNTEKINGGVA